MTNLWTMVICLGIGILARSTGRLPADAHRTLNAFIITFALPALILRYVHAMHFEVGLLMPALMPWALFGAGTAFFVLLGRAAGWSRQTTGGLILSGALANTSFVGLPMIEAIYGTAYLGVGMVVDQLGTYMVLSTLGIVVVMFCAGGARLTLPGLLRKVATFPPFQAMVLALATSWFDYPATALAVLDRLGGTLTPLALVSVGYQLRLREFGGSRLQLASGLGFKLVLGPALMTVLFIFGLHEAGKMAQVTIFESAMGPQIGGAIVAMENGLNPRLVGLMIGVGVPLSLLTATCWSYLLGGV